jgi:putative transposase
VVAACDLMGVSRATWYRRLNPPVRVAEPVPQRQRRQPAALTAAEREQILGYLRDEEFADLSVSQVFYRLFDEGVYVASEASWHRIARAHRLSGDRRAQKSHRSAAIPELQATRPNQVWCWDITNLRSTHRRCSFKAYVILDLFSRYIVGWRVEAIEDGQLAAAMFEDARTAQHADDLEVLHSDRGGPMIGEDITTTLSAFGITQSHSRPRVSNDNPFIESAFKTIKYDIDYPIRFDSLEHARAWIAGYVQAYNSQHRHSGIGHYTPESVHDGSWTVFRNRRQQALDAAWEAHPERHRRRPQAPVIALDTWINKPTTEQLAA